MATPRQNTFPPAVRIRSKQDFDRIFQQGTRASDQHLMLRSAPGAYPFSRLGISVPRRYGNAVRRNRIKRLVREAFRAVRHDLPAGMDWIVIPRPGPEP
ncbi:MAG: ribonuclease P protein component, partial [Candidatus Hydrogenedentes bacterium]|nr:ribonuclease P protein component [Candidatus Hydrogenedentota bacterium]